MANRARDWFAQAEHDLRPARDARDKGSHEWACFAAQQSAEKAVKGLHLHQGQEALDHAGQILEFARSEMAGQQDGD